MRQYPGGIVVSNRYFPNLSRITSDLLILRSVSAVEVGHDRGQFYVQTGRALNPAFAAEIPHAGAIVGHEKDNANALVPPFTAFNDPGVKGATFLGGRFEPFQPGANSNEPGLLVPALFNTQREFNQRYALVSSLDAPVDANCAGDDVKTDSDFYEAAKNLMFDDPIASVFRFSAQDDQRYGATGTRYRPEMARRLLARLMRTGISASRCSILRPTATTTTVYQRSRHGGL